MSGKNKIILTLCILTLLFLVRLVSVDGFAGYYSDIWIEDTAQKFHPIQKHLSSRFDAYLPKNEASLISGILLGAKHTLPYKLKNDLINTSTIHIVVASGQNLTFIVGFILLFSKFITRQKAIGLSFLAIILYSLVTGLDIPILRAGLMLLILLIANLLGKEAQSGYVLLLTALILLLIEPNWLLSISFQLSFMATLGSIIVAPQLLKALNFLPEVVKEAAAVTLATQALTLPIIGYNFQTLSLVALPANILVLFTVPFIMLTGTILLIVDLISQTMATFISTIPYLILRYFIYIVEISNNLEFASIKIPKLPIAFWVGYYFWIVGIYFILTKKDRTHDLIE